MDALDIVRVFQDTEGWSEDTMVLLLTDFINAEKLNQALDDYLKSRRGDESIG